MVCASTLTCQCEHMSTVCGPVGWFSWATMPKRTSYSPPLTGVTAAGMTVADSIGP